MTLAYAAATARWQPVQPREASALMGQVPARWWIAGGWALGLFVGRQGRAHKDLDVGILRRDVRQVLAAMSGWEFFEASGDTLSGPLADSPRENVHSLWARPRHTDDWRLEVLLDECEGEQWIFRRDRSIQRPLDLAIRHDSEGIPHLAPEIQLLYKASRIRAEDQLDFERAAPLLDHEPRHWLCGALARVNSQHPWLSALRMT